MPEPIAHISISWVNVRREESLTLVFDTGTGFVQLDARVEKDGEIVLFCDTDLETRPFAEETPV